MKWQECSLFIGGFMIAFGFWGIDWAFLATKENRQIYLPVVHKYVDPDDWWNLNFVIATSGTLLAVVSALYL